MVWKNCMTTFATISHKDAKAEYEFIQAKQIIKEKILEQADIKERRVARELQDAMKNFPCDLSKKSS